MCIIKKNFSISCLYGPLQLFVIIRYVYPFMYTHIKHFENFAKNMYVYVQNKFININVWNTACFMFIGNLTLSL